MKTYPVRKANYIAQIVIGVFILAFGFLFPIFISYQDPDTPGFVRGIFAFFALFGLAFVCHAVLCLTRKYAAAIEGDRVYFYSGLNKRYSVEINDIVGVYAAYNCQRMGMSDKTIALQRPNESMPGTVKVYLNHKYGGPAKPHQTACMFNTVSFVLELLKVKPDIAAGLGLIVQSGKSSRTVYSRYNLLHYIDPAAPEYKNTDWREELQSLGDDHIHTDAT